VQNKDLTRFYFIEEIKQGYDKKPKTNVEHIKVMGNSTSTYTNWAPSSRKFFKKLPICM